MSDRFAAPRTAGLLAFKSGDYETAAKEFSKGAEQAGAAGDLASHGRFLSSQGAVLMALGENRSAIHYLRSSRLSSEQAGDSLNLHIVEANLAGLYVITGDYEAAAAAAIRGMEIRPRNQSTDQRFKSLGSFGRAIAKTQGVDRAAHIFRQALEVAPTASTRADILELWGNELSQQDWSRAHQALELLARAWWERARDKDPERRIPQTAGKLARLYRRMGNIRAARIWINKTIDALDRGQKLAVPEWVMRAEEAEISTEEGHEQAGLDGFRRAYRLVEEWRRALPLSDRLRLGAEKRMATELFEGYLRAAGRLYRKKPNARLAAEMFALIQNTRAWSIETTGPAKGDDQALLAEARRLEANWLAGDEAARSRLKLVRASILEQEASARPETGGHPGHSSYLEKPAATEAILTYWLHEEGSWLWVWTNRALSMRPLAPKGKILAAVAAFRHAIEADANDTAATGVGLRKMLLGNLDIASAGANRWDIVADEGLFQVPFGALPGEHSRYLAEEVELRLVPNALRHPSRSAGVHKFLAIADPIFNSADERRKTGWMRPRTVFAAGLPRLPGTKREAAAAERVWRKAGYETAIHLGEDSGEESVLARLNQWQPGIIHIATHTATPANDAARPRLALSLRQDGGMGLLTAEDISALRLRADLVVMSACHSTGAEAASGTGQLGLTRAWLTAGTRQVVSTLWPVGDESTQFFSEFYRRLAANEGSNLPNAAPALRQAQLACIRAGGLAAQPRHWAGHVLLARR
ncbi:MAG: CHAT domain-containing protein [Acidobacteria bacterium]|nr:CHAT domain-containing protein [Acidobacteriota bacterium]